MTNEVEEALRLLTRLARGDVALVQDALLKHDSEGVEKVIEYIKKKRKDRLAA